MQPSATHFKKEIDYVEFNGDDSVNRGIPHKLNAKPSLVIMTVEQLGLQFMKIVDGQVHTTFQTASYQIAVTAADNNNFYVGNATNYDQSGNGLGHTYRCTVFA